MLLEEETMKGKSKESLRVLNPRGEIEAVPTIGVSPRVAELEGKRIGLYWNGKPDGDYFWDVVEGLLREKFPTAAISRYNGPGDLGVTLADKIAKEVDTLMYGVGD